MARIDFSGIPEVLADLRRRQEAAGPVAAAILDAGAAAAVSSWRETITRLGMVKTGAMRDSISAKAGKDEMSREITAKGKDEKGVRNGQKAFILHYGTSRITASYWWTTAEQEAEPKVTAAMKRIWDTYNATGSIPQASAGDVFVSTSGGRRSHKK